MDISVTESHVAFNMISTDAGVEDLKYLYFLGIIGLWKIGEKLWEDEEDGV